MVPIGFAYSIHDSTKEVIRREGADNAYH
jgi:hypothetical protein